jgi:hypothetical protein
MPGKNRAAQRAERQKQREAYQAMSPQERRRSRRQASRQQRTGQTAAERPQPPDPWGPPLGEGEPFDNDPNTMWSYYNPPQTFDFSDDNAAGNFNDPFNQFLSAVPVMQRQTERSVQDALAQFGSGGLAGNRYSSAAMGTAADIGAASAERQNQMLTEMMERFANNQLDRQMAAAQGYINATPMAEEGMMNRLGFNYQMANQAQDALERERARQASNERFRYQQWKDQRYGNLPFLTQFLRDSIGQGPDPIFNTSPGKEGARNDVMDAAKLWMMYSS